MNASVQNNWPESWRVLEHGIRSGRYTDPAFAGLEYEKLWSRVWQAAARLDEIPHPGDYTTYEIGEQSVMIVRVVAVVAVFEQRAEFNRLVRLVVRVILLRTANDLPVERVLHLAFDQHGHGLVGLVGSDSPGQNTFGHV